MNIGNLLFMQTDRSRGAAAGGGWNEKDKILCIFQPETTACFLYHHRGTMSSFAGNDIFIYTEQGTDEASGGGKCGAEGGPYHKTGGTDIAQYPLV